MKSNKLVIVMMVLLVISIFISLFSIYYIYSNRQNFLESVQRNVQTELAQYKIPTADDIKIDHATILLAVAKYCQIHDGCTGSQGITGQQGIQGLQGLIGLTGPAGKDGVNGKDGYTPQKGVDYFDGTDGQPGQDGTKMVQRCNQKYDRVEWQYEGDESWQVLYYLSKNQKCA